MLANTIIITDRLSDYRDFQQALRRQANPTVWLIEAQDLRFFEHETYPQQPDLVLLDIAESVTRCLAATVRVRALFPCAKVAVRAEPRWKNFAYLAVQAGAHGVIDAAAYGTTRNLSVLIESILAGNLVYRNISEP